MVGSPDARAWQTAQERLGPLVYGDHWSKQRHAFMDRLRRSEGHWLWDGMVKPGRKGGQDYAVFYVRATPGAKRNQVTAFRFLMETFFPEVPFTRGAHYRRTCEDARCISPYHRSRSKTTWKERGRPNPYRKYTDEQILSVLRAEPDKLHQSEQEAGISHNYALALRRGNAHRELYVKAYGKEPEPCPWMELDAKMESRRKTREKKSGRCNGKRKERVRDDLAH